MTEKSAMAEHAWVNHHHQLRGDISAGQGQRTRGTTAVGGLARQDDNCRGAFQPRQRAGDPRFLDSTNEETGREGHPTFDLQLHHTSNVYPQ